MTLLGTLTSLFQSSAALATAMPGSPWLDEPVEGTAFPFTVVTGVEETADLLDFEHEDEVKSHFTFEIYGVGEAAIEAFALTVDALLNWSDTNQPGLAVSGRTLLSVARKKYTLHLDRTRSALAQRVSVATLVYEASWEEKTP